MNINVFLGTISFVIWSTFSTWFYVNFIKVFDSSPQKEILMPVKASKNHLVSDEDRPTVVVLSPIQLSKTFTFHKNTADLIHVTAIKQFTDSIQTILSDRNISISITGYTCDLGSEAYNQNLGLERANYAAKALSQSSIKRPQMITSSEGESDPLVPNTSELNRIKNRRVTILINSKP
ncbi:MAG: outer membrane protein OmpA-like peptidoglycan-associated protein [Cyclobacteriaceae bacterium]|jgi:outer membrane protein OmpA-like peptidoglycan-associated protein